MTIILLEEPLSGEELALLQQEFPYFRWREKAKIKDSEWPEVEILFGRSLSIHELSLADQLHWIHTPEPHHGALYLEEIEIFGNILITITPEQNSQQIAEFVLTGISLFAKQLLTPTASKMWDLSECTLLQVGLGNVGSAIAERATLFGMKVWGAADHRSFNPHCRKVFSIHEIHSLLPTVDIASFISGTGMLFGKKELEQMKDDSILIVTGETSPVVLDDIFTLAKEGKWRGVLLDVGAHIHKKDIPQLIVTPHLAAYPRKASREAFHLFRYNLRQYVHGDVREMKNVIQG